jgi:hypothetical protein
MEFGSLISCYELCCISHTDTSVVYAPLRETIGSVDGRPSGSSSSDGVTEMSWQMEEFA